jgi:hypothetical protein
MRPRCQPPRDKSCPGAAICTSIGELTNFSPIHIHDEDLVLATSTWPEGHKKDFASAARPGRSPTTPLASWISGVFWGLIGGGLGGQLLSMLTSGEASTAGMAATGSGMDVDSILSSLAGGGVGGAVVMAIVGLIKAKMAKSS